MTIERLRGLLRLVAILAGVTWAILCWRAWTASESRTVRGWRTLAFSVMVCAGMVAARPRRDEGHDEAL